MCEIGLKKISNDIVRTNYNTNNNKLLSLNNYNFSLKINNEIIKNNIAFVIKNGKKFNNGKCEIILKDNLSVEIFENNSKKIFFVEKNQRKNCIPQIKKFINNKILIIENYC